MLFLKEIRNRYGNIGSVVEPPLFGRLRLQMANVPEPTPNVKTKNKKQKNNKSNKRKPKNTNKNTKKHQKNTKKTPKNTKKHSKKSLKLKTDLLGPAPAPGKKGGFRRLRSRPKSGGSRRLRLRNTEHRYGSY